MKYAQLVIGPAGSGKSSYCSAMARHGEAIGRRIYVANLDPAAESFDYEPIVDVRTLVTVQEAMEDDDLRLGPNGGLLFCMNFLASNDEWLQENFADFDDEYILFDCPGQIELFTHEDSLKRLAIRLEAFGFRVCIVFLLDSLFASDAAKFYSAALVALAAQVALEMPCITFLSKMDLLEPEARDKVLQSLDPENRIIDEMDDKRPKWAALNRALASVVDDFSLVQLSPLNLEDEESIMDALLIADMALQYGEDEEVKAKDIDEPEPVNIDGDS